MFSIIYNIYIYNALFILNALFVFLKLNYRRAADGSNKPTSVSI